MTQSFKPGAEHERSDVWLHVLLGLARHYRLQASEEQARVALSWMQQRPLDDRLDRVAHLLGLQWRWMAWDHPDLAGDQKALKLPLVLVMRSGKVGLLQRLDIHGQGVVAMEGGQGLEQELSAAELDEQVLKVFWARPKVSVPDARVDDYIKPYRPDWLRDLISRDWRRYIDVAAASLVANVLALSAVIFSTQVYDRVVPAKSMPTLWVLFGGVMLAMVFEMVMRIMRTRITDLVGKRADMRISDRVFGHALRIRTDARPASTGSFISQLREIEQVRELITSTTLSVLADLPFLVFFAVVMMLLAGPLAWIPILGLPLMVLPGLLLQRKLAQLSQEGMRESAIRNAILIESVQGAEDIKLARAEDRFLSQWNHLTEVSAQIALRQRGITNFLAVWSQQVSSMVYAGVLLVGAYLVIGNQITTGVLVGASILASRMMAPMAPLASVLGRWQQAKVAIKGLNDLLMRPVDQPEGQVMAQVPLVRGHYQLRQTQYAYDPVQGPNVLNIEQLTLAAGEKVAVLGRNGAGKSTLLYLMAGLLPPTQGEVLIDDLRMNSVDPADLRRDVALLSQNSSLFFGTIRDNLKLGVPQATEAEMAQALEMAGALGFVNALSAGMNHVIKEGGAGLSGGQRQALLLARLILRNPQVVLLDEPTAWMDEVTERQVIANLKNWLGTRTLVVATHRLPVLALVDRVWVIDGGKVAMNDTREAVLKTVRSAPATPAPSATNPAAPHAA